MSRPLVLLFGGQSSRDAGMFDRLEAADPVAGEAARRRAARYLTGPVDKSNPVERQLYVERCLRGEPREVRARAASCEDAFDAAVSALQMQRFARDFARLARQGRRALERREGRIWTPLRDPVFERW